MAKRSNTQKAAKDAAKYAKKHPKVVIILAAVLAVLIIALVILLVVRPDLLHKSLGLGDHEWGDPVVQTEATCDDDGLQYKECKLCGIKEPEVVPAKGHSLVPTENIVPPTCGAEGSAEFICSVCDEHITQTIDATGNHEWGNYEVKTPATCAAGGVEERECSVCGDKEERELPATGNHDFGDGEICSVCGFDKSSFIGEESEITAENTLSIHFIAPEVKASGDCTLIKYGNTEILIDAGPNQANAKTINKYLEKYCTDNVLEYVISTHSDSDHISGFVGNKKGDSYDGVLYTYRVGTFIDFPRTNKKGTEDLYSKYLAAKQYAKNTYDTKLITALDCWKEENGASKTYYLDEEHKVSMNILYNYYYENDAADENDYSVCMLLKQEYDGGEHNYLFTGDLEEKGERYLVQYNTLPEVDLYKAGHHGSKTSTTNELLSVIKPKHVAVCCCAGYNQYNAKEENVFPTQAFIDRISQITDSVYVTIKEKDDKSGYEQMNGTIVFYCGGASNKVKLWCSNNTTKLKDTEWFKANRTGWTD